MGRLLLPLLAAFLSLGLLLTGAQAKETPAYVALGDSLAFGVGASDPAAQGYVGLTFDGLRKSDRYRERGLELVNLSVPGATSSDLLLPGGQLQAALREISERQDDRVEIISIDIGGNDFLALGTPGSSCLSDPLGDPCRQRFVDLVDGLQANLTQVVRSLRDAAPRADILIVGLYNPYSGTGTALEVPADFVIQQLNDVLRSVAADPDLRAKMADILDLFGGRGAQWIAADGFHPNDKGYTVIAEALLAAIQSREPNIPEELLAEPAAPTSVQPLADPSPNGGGPDLLFWLAIVIPAAFLGGAVISGAYFLARGAGPARRR